MELSLLSLGTDYFSCYCCGFSIFFHGISLKYSKRLNLASILQASYQTGSCVFYKMFEENHPWLLLPNLCGSGAFFSSVAAE